MFTRTGRCVSQYGPAPNILIAGSLPAVNLPRQAGTETGAGSTWARKNLLTSAC